MPSCAKIDCIHYLRPACIDCVWSAPDRRDRYRPAVPRMLPSELTIEEVEVIVCVLDLAWQYSWLGEEEKERATAAREKLLRYVADECCWHGRVG